MFPEFGQAPLSLNIDLDSYEGPWPHIAAFQGGSGWLQIARATIQSEHDMLRADLIAACDDQGSAIPSWRAMHLTECAWSRLEPCFDEPPAVLDDLLCEEEGSFYARWQRETNTELALLFDQAQRRIEALEAKAAARTRAIEHQISDLRRRRRMLECSIEARIALGAVIADLEAENDAAVASLADQRATLRRQADAAEEALWQRTDVLIEIEPRITVRWRAASIEQERRPSRIWRQGEYYDNAAPYEGVEDREEPEEVLARFAAALQANAEKADAERAARETQKVSHARAPALPKHSPALRKLPSLAPARCENASERELSVTGLSRQDEKLRENVLVRRERLEAKARRLRDALAKTGSHPRWREQTEAKLGRIERGIAEIDNRLESQGPARSGEEVQSTLDLPTLATSECNGTRSAPSSELELERTMLAAKLEDLVERGRKLLPGSPKTQRNQDERVELERRIARLDRGIAKGGLFAVEGRNWTAIETDILRKLWLEGCSASEIAQRIGRVSRNAVISKAKRLELPIRAQGDLPPRQTSEDELTG